MGTMQPILTVHAAEAPTLVDRLDLSALEAGRTHRLAVHLVDDAASRPIRAPTLVLVGHRSGPVVGLTAALHGNELNGIPTIHGLFARVAPEELAGTLVGVTIANVPGYLRHQRGYTDGADLNRIMPGHPFGSESQIYAHRLLERILDRADVLIDLHTASFGRVNCLYVRANLDDPASAALARSIGAEVIVHNPAGDGTLRGAMADRGAPAITVEIGDPQVIERGIVRTSRIGIRDALEQLGMLPEDEERTPKQALECRQSAWLYTDAGGLLHVLPSVGERVADGQLVARLHDPWGQLLRSYHSPATGVVIGKSTNPVCRSGSRILHLGVTN